MEAWQIAVTIILVYCILVMLIGYLARRVFKSSLEDFYVLSRRAGVIVIFLATAATYHSAYAFLSGPSMFATVGVSFWIAQAPIHLMTGATLYLVGTRVMKLGKARGHITPGDGLADFYDSEHLRVLVAIITSTFLIAYIVVQAIGLGLIIDLSSAGRIPYMWGSLFLISVAAAYVIIGGLRAAYWTDVLQGIWMYLGIAIAAIMIAKNVAPGGFFQVVDQLRTINPDFLVMKWGPSMLIGGILANGAGTVLLPHLWIKFYASKDVKTQKIAAAGTFAYISSYFIWAAIIGLTAALLNNVGLPGVLEKGFIKTLTSQYGSADAVMITMLLTFFSPLVAGFLLAGAAAAAMSTLDSFLGAISLQLVRDVYQRHIRPGRSEHEYVVVSRILIVVWGLIGWFFAIQKPGLIFNIAAIALAGGAQLLPITVQMILPRRKIINKYGALAGYVVGSILVLVFSAQTGGRVGMPVTFHPWQANVIAITVNVLLALIVSQLTRDKTSQKELQTFEEYKKILYTT